MEQRIETVIHAEDKETPEYIKKMAEDLKLFKFEREILEKKMCALEQEADRRERQQMLRMGFFYASALSVVGCSLMVVKLIVATLTA